MDANWKSEDFVTHKTQLFSLISSISPKIKYNRDEKNIEFLNEFRAKLEKAQQEVEQARTKNDSKNETDNPPRNDNNPPGTLSKCRTCFSWWTLCGFLLLLGTMYGISQWKDKGKDIKHVGIQKMNISWDNYTEFEMDDSLTGPTTSVFPVDENVKDNIPLHPNNALIVEDKPTMQLPPPPSPSSLPSPSPSLSSPTTNPSAQLSKTEHQHQQKQGESKGVCLREEKLKGEKNISSITTLGNQLVQGSVLHSNNYDFISSLIHTPTTEITCFLILFLMFCAMKNTRDLQ